MENLLGELSRKANDRIEALTEKYILQMPIRIQEVRDAAFEVKKTPDDIKKVQELRYFIHKLSGSGATFGFISLSEKVLARRSGWIFEWNRISLA